VAVNESVTELTSLQLIEGKPESRVCFFDIVAVKHRNELAEFVRIETSSVVSQSDCETELIFYVPPVAEIGPLQANKKHSFS
jgi:hypothetical protein